MMIVELESISADFLSSLWLDNSSLENSNTLQYEKIPQQKFQWKLCAYSISAIKGC